MKNLSNYISEARQFKVDIVIKDMQKAYKSTISHFVIIPSDDDWYDELCAEIEQKGAIGPVVTDCGKLYGIKK